MASRKVLASKVYQRFLQICEQWPVDNSRVGRDLGAHIKENFGLQMKNSKMEVGSVETFKLSYNSDMLVCCVTYFCRSFSNTCILPDEEMISRLVCSVTILKPLINLNHRAANFKIDLYTSTNTSIMLILINYTNAAYWY